MRFAAQCKEVFKDSKYARKKIDFYNGLKGIPSFPLNNLNLFSFTYALSFNIASSFNRNIQTNLFNTYFYMHILAFYQCILLIHILKERRFFITQLINIQCYILLTAMNETIFIVSKILDISLPNSLF